MFRAIRERTMNPQTRARLILLTTLLLSLAACGFASVACGQEPTAASVERGSIERVDAADHDSHPVLPAPQPWHAITVMLIVGMFVAAAAVGIMVRLNSWDEEIPPPAHSHDEPP